MKKSILKICSVLLVTIMLFAFCACEKDDQDAVTLKSISEKTIVADSNVDLVANSQTDYKILYPIDSSAMDNMAVRELVTFFQEATGIELVAELDDGSNYSNGHYISIGKTSVFNSANINVDSVKLGSSGFIIKRVDNNVVIYGAGYYGNLFGVYGFLQHQFDYEIYAEDEIHINRNVTNAKLKDFDLTDIPDIDYRLGGNGDIAGYAGNEYMYRMRMMNFSDVYCGSWNEGDILPFHNYFSFVSPSECRDNNPQWLSPDGTQLCLTRDPEGLMDYIFPKITALLEKYPTRNTITFTQQDTNGWCSHCTQEYYATHQETGRSEDSIAGANMSMKAKEYFSLQNITFMNELAKRLKVWNEQNCPERDIVIYLFSYAATNACPVKEDENGNAVLDVDGNYQKFDDNLEISDNLGVLYCYTLNTQYTGEYDDVSQNYIDNIKRWETLSEHFSFWAYGTNFNNYFAPYNAVQTLQDDIKLSVEAGAKVYYYQSQFNIKTPIDWGRLESYLQSKLEWDCNADMSELINNFFDNYYKDASEVMKEIYRDYASYMSYLANEKHVGTKRNTSGSLLTTDNWSYQTLIGFLNKFDQAYQKIEYLKYVDADLYKKLYNRINIETFTFRYILYSLYPNMFEYSQLEQLKADLIAECKTLGVSQMKETAGIDSLFD